MNYLAHGIRFLDRPWFLAGTAVPDWLSVADRGVRVREKHVAALAAAAVGSDRLQAVESAGGNQLQAADAVPITPTAGRPTCDPHPRPPEGGHDERAEIAAGILQHLEDDRWFHQTAAFYETCGELTRLFRGVLGPGDGHRPGFLGHVATELLIDLQLIERDPRQLEGYYAALEAIDPVRVEEAVNALAPRPTARLATFIEIFRRERFLADYREPARLVYRLNQVLRRIKLDPLPDSFSAALDEAGRLVGRRLDLLLPRDRFR